jgi:hypothetical protein
MQDVFRPYSLVVRGDDTDASSITLVDSAGTALKCNYISVQASGEDGGFYRAAIDVTGLTTPLASWPTVDGAIDVTTSAAPCQFASTANGAVDFVLLPTDVASAVNIRQQQADDTIYFISYGYVKGPTNPNRNEDYPSGS